MRLFRRLYDKLLSWSDHKHAPYYLAGVSFVESSIFPIPPDVMLIPMVLAKPLKAWQYAFITTLASILGGLLGYAIGYYAFELIGDPIIQMLGCQNAYTKAVSWFKEYGFLAVLIAGFTPIPYKMFTIAAGASFMALGPFFIASIFGRGLRFFLVAAVIRLFGKKLEPMVIKYIDFLGWGFLALFGLVAIVYYAL